MPMSRRDKMMTRAEVTETTSLLHGVEAQHDEHAKSQNDQPMSKVVMALLCYARLMEPMASFSIYPFVAEMAQRNGNLKDADVGFYSGLIMALFSATQTLTLLFWSNMANRLGHKTVLIISLCGMMVGLALFGISTSLWQMIAFRILAGGFSGANFLIRVMIGHNCTEETRTKAFSWYSLAGNIGILLGSAIAGALTHPVIQFPSVFGSLEFFHRHPYALSGFTISALTGSAALTSFFFVVDLSKTVEKRAMSETRLRNEDSEEHLEQPTDSVWHLIKAPRVISTIWVYGHITMLVSALVALHPLVLYTTVDLGGLGASSLQITLSIIVQGVSEAAWLLFVFPYLQSRTGTRAVVEFGVAVLSLYFAGYVVLNAFLREGSDASHTFFWLTSSALFTLGPCVWMAYTGAQLALNELSAEPGSLGKLNALAETINNILKSAIPVLFTSLFAIGARTHLCSGYLVWIILIGLTLSLSGILRWLSHEKRVRRNG